MSNRLLQQEEIDALLNAQVFEPAQVDAAVAESLVAPVHEAATGAGFPGEQYGVEANGAELVEERSEIDLDSLSDEEKDALGEVGNICMGSAATTLSKLLSQPVSITSPMVTVTTMEEFFKGFVIPHMTIYVRFIEGISGYNLLVIKLQDAAILADLMMGGDGTNITEEITEIGVSAASEAMNQMIGTASTAMAAMFGQTVNISPPETKIYHSADELKSPEPGDEAPVVVVWFKMNIGNILDTNIMQVMGMNTAREEANFILSQLLQAGGGEYSPDLEEPPEQGLSDNAGGTGISEMGDALEPAEPAEAAKEANDSPAIERQSRITTGGARLPASAKPVTAPPGFDQQRLDLILDIPLKVTVLLGRTRWPIKDILGLTPGSVVEMQSMVDEPVEVLVNGILVAMGEVVVVNENFGVRITNIISPEERLKNLGR
jgi:flagellar motor switch protein FliN/FliY